MTPFKTQNPLRAMAWIRVINEWIYNLQDGSSANTEDFQQAFPQFSGGSVWDPPTARVAQVAELRALRHRLVETFDVPADGVPGQCR